MTKGTILIQCSSECQGGNQTRWVRNKEAIAIVHHMLPALLADLSLQARNEPTAQGLYNFAKNQYLHPTLPCACCAWRESFHPPSSRSCAGSAWRESLHPPSSLPSAGSAWKEWVLPSSYLPSTVSVWKAVLSIPSVSKKKTVLLPGWTESKSPKCNSGYLYHCFLYYLINNIMKKVLKLKAGSCRSGVDSGQVAQLEGCSLKRLQ